MPADPPVLVLHGEESFLIDEEARRRIEALKKDLVSDFGYEALDAGAISVEKLRDAVIQAPFLDPHRAIVVRGLAARRADSLAPALAQVPDTSRVLITVLGKLPAASRLAKAAVAAGGQVRELAAPRGRALTDWVHGRAREYGLPPLAGAAVLRSSRADLGVIDSELAKLAAYKAGGQDLDPTVIGELLAGGRQEEIFRLTDLLLPRPAGEAWTVLRGLLEREGATLIAYRLARHLSLVLEVRTRQDRGETLAQLQAEMREHNFVIQKAFEVARITPPERLEAGMRALLDYEWEVKSGQIDAELGLQATLAKL